MLTHRPIERRAAIACTDILASKSATCRIKYENYPALQGKG